MSYEGRSPEGIERERTRARERSRRIYADPVLLARERKRKAEVARERMMRQGYVSDATWEEARPWADAVCAASGLSWQALKGRGRQSLVSTWRQVLWHLLRKHTILTFEEIGDIFERDHTTVLYGAGKIAESPPELYSAMIEKVYTTKD